MAAAAAAGTKAATLGRNNWRQQYGGNWGTDAASLSADTGASGFGLKNIDSILGQGGSMDDVRYALGQARKAGVTIGGKVDPLLNFNYGLAPGADWSKVGNDNMQDKGRLGGRKAGFGYGDYTTALSNVVPRADSSHLMTHEDKYSKNIMHALIDQADARGIETGSWIRDRYGRPVGSKNPNAGKGGRCGERIDMPGGPGGAVTGDFIDSDRDGVDDRYKTGPGAPSEGPGSRKSKGSKKGSALGIAAARNKRDVKQWAADKTKAKKELKDYNVSDRHTDYKGTNPNKIRPKNFKDFKKLRSSAKKAGKWNKGKGTPDWHQFFKSMLKRGRDGARWTSKTSSRKQWLPTMQQLRDLDHKYTTGKQDKGSKYVNRKNTAKASRYSSWNKGLAGMIDKLRKERGISDRNIKEQRARRTSRRNRR